MSENYSLVSEIYHNIFAQNEIRHFSSPKRERSAASVQIYFCFGAKFYVEANWHRLANILPDFLSTGAIAPSIILVAVAYTVLHVGLQDMSINIVETFYWND